MTTNEIISSGLLELYVLGMATEQEAAQVQAYAKEYPEVAAEIEAIELGMEHYAQVHGVNPSVKLKEKIFTAVTEPSSQQSLQTAPVQQATEAKVVSISPSWKYVAAASVILLIGSMFMNYNYYNKYETAEAGRIAMEQKNVSLENNLASQTQTLGELNANMQIVQSRYSEPHSLNGLPQAPDPTAKAKIFWMKNTGEVYIDASNLPDAPAGKQYQFWGIVDGKPVDGGMIIMNSKQDKYRIQKMKVFGNAEAFAVTLEEKGGKPQPEGPMFVMGKM